MSNSHRDRQNASADDHPDRPDHAADPPGDLPPEPNPEHPRHYPDEARMWYKRLKSDKWDWYDLGAREIGLVLWHHRHLVVAEGGDPA